MALLLVTCLDVFVGWIQNESWGWVYLCRLQQIIFKESSRFRWPCERWLPDTWFQLNLQNKLSSSFVDLIDRSEPDEMTPIDPCNFLPSYLQAFPLPLNLTSSMQDKAMPIIRGSNAFSLSFKKFLLEKNRLILVTFYLKRSRYLWIWLLQCRTRLFQWFVALMPFHSFFLSHCWISSLFASLEFNKFLLSSKKISCALQKGNAIIGFVLEVLVSSILVWGERMRFLFKGYDWGQSLNRWGACPPPATIRPRAQFNRFRLSAPS